MTPPDEVAHAPASRPPRPPEGLGDPGKALWKRLTKALDFEPRELVILEQACRQADEISALDAVLAKWGHAVRGSRNQPRLNPAVAEVRQARQAFARLLDVLDIPTEDEQVGQAGRTRRAQKAARVRWGQQHAGQLHAVGGGDG